MVTKAKPSKLSAAELPLNLDPLAAVVLAALPGATDEQRDALSGGDHEVDMEILLRVRGKLAIGPDTPVRQVNKLKPWTLVKLLANKLPQAALDECIDRAIAVAKAPKGSEEAAAAVMEEDAGEEMKARVEAAFEQAGQAVDKIRRGSVRLLGSVEVEVRE